MAKADLLEGTQEEAIDECIEKAYKLYESGDIDSALRCFDEGIENNPDELDWYMEKADFCFDIGESEKALKVYDLVDKKFINPK